MSELCDLFATRLRRLRHQRDLSTKELAAKSGISAAGISQIETGYRRNPTLASVEALAAALGCTVTDMLIVPSCASCDDAPPPGYTCNACGKGGTS